MPRLRPVRLLALLLAPALALGAQDRPAPATTAITNVTVIDVDAGRRLPGRTVLVRGGRIAWVAPAHGAAVPAGARRVDGRGRFLIPGLWDAHVHVGTRREVVFPLLLAHGVTSARDLHFATTNATAGAVALRDSAAAGLVLAPRYLVSTLIAAPGFIDSTGVTAATPEEGRALVRDAKARGVDLIKVYGGLTPATFAAIHDEARRLGLPVDGHVSNLVGVQGALDAGQRTLEHVAESGVLAGCTRADSALRADVIRARTSPTGGGPRGPYVQGFIRRMSEAYDEPACRALARRMAAAGTALTPTLYNARFAYARFDAPALAAADQPYVTPAMRTWYEGALVAARARPQQDEWRAHVRREREIVRLMQSEGVRILAGTDVGNLGFPPAGITLHEELGLLVAAGLTPLEALRGATLNPARAFGMADSLGTVARGRVADLVLLDADPLADVGNARRIVGVMTKGRWLDRAALDALLAGVRERVAAER